MDSLEFLQKVLGASVEKNGEIPLTNRHLLNTDRCADAHVDAIKSNNRLKTETTRRAEEMTDA